jgi:hypothetical protein
MADPAERVRAVALQRFERLANLFASAIAIALAVGSAVAYLSKQRGIAVHALFLLAGLLLGWAASHLVFRLRRRIGPTPTEITLILGYRMERKEMIYRITDDLNHHVFESKDTIRVVRDGLNHVERRFSWTGRGKRTVAATSKGHFMMGPEQRYGQWDYFYVFLGRPFAKGEPVEVAYMLDLYPEHFSTVEPYIYLDGANPVPNELVLRVQFPSNAPKVTGTCLVVRRSDNRVVDAALPEIVSDRNEALWRVAPKLGFQYHLRWEWPEEWYNLDPARVPTA